MSFMMLRFGLQKTEVVTPTPRIDGCLDGQMGGCFYSTSQMGNASHPRDDLQPQLWLVCLIGVESRV